MLEKCRLCGKKLVVVGSLCMMCFAGAATPADANFSTTPAPQHVTMVATPPLDSELPHVAEEDFLTHVPASDSSAGGGRTVQGAAMLSGEGHLQAGGTTHRVGSSSLSGSGTLGGGGVVTQAAALAGQGSLSAG